MLRLHFFTLLVFTFSLLTACGPEKDEKELIASVKKEKLGQALDVNMAIEREEVGRQYRQKGLAFRQEMSLEAYHSDLNSRYNQVVKKVSENYQLLNPEEDPGQQILEMRERLLDQEKIPHWYRELRRAHVKRIIEVNTDLN